MALANHLLGQLCLAAILACTTAQAQEPPPHPDAGKTAYLCDRVGSTSWQAEPCAPGHQQLETGRVRNDGTIERDNPLPVTGVRPPAEPAPAPAPTPTQAAAAVADRAAGAAPPSAQPPSSGYIANPWSWLLGFALAFGVVGKLLGKSFFRSAVVGVLAQFILVGLDLMPFK